MIVHEQLCTPTGAQEIALEWWDCVISAELSAKLGAAYAKASKHRVAVDRKNGHLITAAGPLVWLKQRLNDAGLLPVSGNPPPDDKPTATTAVLHVGFLCVPETEEMMCRLRNEPLPTDTNNPARSKMFETAQKQIVTPIDALAGKVTHGPAGENK
jgi:hypothetical protein